MNRKNIQNKYSPTNSSKISSEVQRTGSFGVSQFVCNQNQNNQSHFNKTKNYHHYLPLNQIQPYLMQIHSTLIQNLRKKSIQRNLSQQQQELIESIKNNPKGQQFLSGILAIQACVKQLVKQNTSTITAFVKATNLLLINYKFLYFDYMNMKNTVKNNIRTSQTLSYSRKSQNYQLEDKGFYKFFDSLKFMALLIKNYWNDVDYEDTKHKQETNSQIVQNLKEQISKLQDLITFQSINNQSQGLYSDNLKQLQQKLVCLHNEQEHIIISQLQKQNNFLKYQIYQKQNTITEYEQSIYNVDLSRYRQNEERQDYWAGYVKFNSNQNSKNYSRVIMNQNSVINYNKNGNWQNTIKKQTDSYIKQRQQLSSHLSILSKRMEQLEQENKKLKKQLKDYRQESNSNNYSNYDSSTVLQRQKQKLDILIVQINQMKQKIIQLETVQLSTENQVKTKTAQLQQKNQQIKNLLDIISERQKQIIAINQSINNHKQIILIKQEEINQMNQQFIKEMEKYNTVFYKLSEDVQAANKKADSFQKQNIKLSQKNKKLQEQIVKEQAIIIDMQTKSACYDFQRRPDSFIPNQIHYSNNQRKLSKNKQLKANIRQLLSKDRQQKSLNQYQRYSTFQSPKQPWNIQKISHKPMKSQNRSKTPTKTQTQAKDKIKLIQQNQIVTSAFDNKDSSRKTMTIKIQGNKIFNEISDKKSQQNRKSALLIRIQNNKKEEKQNSGSAKKLSIKKTNIQQVSHGKVSSHKIQLSPNFKR